MIVLLLIVVILLLMANTGKVAFAGTPQNLLSIVLIVLLVYLILQLVPGPYWRVP